MKRNKTTAAAFVAASLAQAAFVPALAGTGSEPDQFKDARAWKPGDPISFLEGAVTVDLSLQTRFEFRENNFDFNSGVDSVTDDAWLLERVRIGLQFKPASWVALYVQGQDAREIGSERADIPGVSGAEGDDPFDLRQAWVRLGGKELNLQVGRFPMNYGDQRLIGGFEWNNIARTFDGARVHWKAGGTSIDVFATSVVVPDREGFNESSLSGLETHSYFSGVHASFDQLGWQVTDAYALWLKEDGDTSFGTFGTRFKSKDTALGSWGYDAELAFQKGDVGGRELTAFAAHGGVSYTLAAPWNPELHLQYSFASGDRDPADSRVETFQNLYPTNHLYYGYMDLFSWQNIHNPALGLSVKPCKRLVLRADYHLFWLEKTSDGWYRANGKTLVRPIDSDADSFAGSELDLTVQWKPAPYCTVLAGYSHFFAGEYLDDTGASDDADFAYLQVKLDF
jgi:hypothetical protein